MSISSGPDSSHTLSLTQKSKVSEVSIDTLLPTINDGLAKLDQSPIPKKKLQMVNWLKGKIKKICNNLKSVLGIMEDLEEDHEIEDPDLKDIITRLKVKYHDEGTTRNEKIQILTILPSSWGTAKICRTMEAKKYMVEKAKKISTSKGILSMPDTKLGHGIPESTRIAVEQFYNDDQVSTNMPGMKDYVSCRNSENKRIHVQKRLIHCNLKEAFEFFRLEHPSIAIGFSLFASLRPEHCVLAGASGTHTVCVCPIHQNIKLMMLGANFKRLTATSNHPLDHYTDCLKLMLCCDPSPECHLGECKSCPGTAVLSDTLRLAMERDNIDSIEYKNWIFTARAKLETLKKSAPEFIDEFCEKMKLLSPHNFIAKQQSSFIKELRESLEIHEFLVVCDFAENYAFVVQDAAPGFHWNNDAATIYPVTIYFREGDTIVHRSLVVISDCLSHDSVAVYTFSKILVKFIKGIDADAIKIHYFSDGAPQQYKNLNNFTNLYYHERDFGIKAVWHFFPTAHGKGPCDGIGGTVKRQAARASLQLSVDKQITTPEELYVWASDPIHFPNITIKYSSISDYEESKEFLKDRFSKAKSIPGTQQIHSVTPGNDETLIVKRFSRSLESKSYRILKRSLNERESTTKDEKKTNVAKKPMAVKKSATRTRNVARRK